MKSERRLQKTNMKNKEDKKTKLGEKLITVKPFLDYEIIAATCAANGWTCKLNEKDELLLSKELPVVHRKWDFTFKRRPVPKPDNAFGNYYPMLMSQGSNNCIVEHNAETVIKHYWGTEVFSSCEKPNIKWHNGLFEGSMGYYKIASSIIVAEYELYEALKVNTIYKSFDYL